MTTIYFVRHAQPDFSIHDDLTRPLTSDGAKAATELIEYFKDTSIDMILSSPYIRAYDTVGPLAGDRTLDIIKVDNFRERKISDGWIEDFNSFCKNQWEDFTYKLDGGESLSEVADRNVKALNQVLIDYQGKSVVIGSHGTALSTIINYYDQTFGIDDFDRIKRVMPFVVKMQFDQQELTTYQIITEVI